MCRIRLDYNQEIFKVLFKYDDSSPSCLIYVKGNSSFCKSKRQSNDIAGFRGRRSWYVKIMDKSYLVHRIIWFLLNGNIDDKSVIDHIDGNSLNNRIDNLRLVSQTINNRNHAKQKNNKTGKTGVMFSDDGRYRAIWTDNDGKHRSKSFSINKYGDDAFKLASDYRDQIIETLGGYSERHGKDAD